MTLKVGDKVQFEKHGEGFLKAIRTYTAKGVLNRYLVFEFQNETEVIIPEAIMNTFAHYKILPDAHANAKGFGLIELLITIGISSIMMLMFASMITFQVKSMNTVQAVSDSIAFVDTIRSGLKDPTLSTQMLMGNQLTGQILIYDPVVSGRVLAGANTKQQASDAWSVSNVSFDSATLVSTGLYQLTVGMNIKKDANRTIGGPMKHKVLTTIYCHVKNGTITDCNGSTIPDASSDDDCDHDGKGR